MHSKAKGATVAERAWMAAVEAFGCIVCFLFHGVWTPCAVHHLIDGSRRRGHFYTLGLCDPGHHQNTPDKDLKISRHPTEARFSAAYGTEEELFERSRALILCPNPAPTLIY